nr:RNA-directed DNA polymerase, eukaryota, nucleotide-binding alpha-beta plait domain protein [Tanacetum cinerariifolium]
DGNWKSYRSKEDQTQSISQSVFGTNFPDHVTAHDFWKCEMIMESLWMLSFLIRNLKQGGKLGSTCCKLVYYMDWNVGISSDSFKGNVGNSSNSFASVLKSGKPISNPTGKEVTSLVLDDTCFSERDFNLSLMGKVKDITALPNLYVILEEEGFQNFKLSYLGGMWVLIEMESSTASQKFIKHTEVRSWFSSIQPASNSFVSDERIVWISIEGLPLKICVKTKLNEIIYERFKVIIQGKVHWVRAKEMKEWDSLLRNEDYASSSSDEENEQENEGSSSLGNSGGILSVWEPNLFIKENITSSDYFLAVTGTWIPTWDGECVIMGDLTKSAQSKKGNSGGILSVWEPNLFIKENITSSDYFLAVTGTWIPTWDGECVIMGDLTKSAQSKKGGSNEVILNNRSILLKEHQYIISIDSEEVAQKVRCAIEGDEKSKYFHGILNNKRLQLAIRGTFPNGCNSSFIALIPKIQNAKSVKDFRPISLIGSLYKIIAKILANRLSSIISDLISDVQSAFVSNRQILDGPFILNELLSWMERINSWDDVVSKVTYRLSKWKLKTLSIGGRLTLIKSVLTSIPLYQISSFKVPIKVLNTLESIRRKFFNEIEGNERKLALISWETILASKKFGARRLIDEHLLLKGDVQTRWVKVVPIKLNVFAWRVCLDKLPTHLNLSLRGVEISSIMCPLCNSSVESASHLFFSCHVARLIWKKVLRRWDLEENMVDSYDDWLILLNNIRLPKRLKDLFEGVCYVKW